MVQTVLNSKQIGTSATATYVAVTDGTDTTWTDPATISTSPAGNDTEVQFNNSGAFGASSAMTWNGTVLSAQNLDSEFSANIGTILEVNEDGIAGTALRVETSLDPNAFVISSTTGLVWNEIGDAAADFRVEGGTDNNLINADAGLDQVGIGVVPNKKLTVEGTVGLKEQASADADTVAYGQIWVKSSIPNELWFTDDAGTDFRLASRLNFGFGSTTPMIGAGTTVLNYGSASQWAIAPITGRATHVSFYLQGWVDDANVDIKLSYGTLGAETVLTVVENVAAASGAQAIAVPPSITAGEVLYVSVVNTGGDDVIATFSVTITMTE